MKFGLKEKNFTFISETLKNHLGNDSIVWCFGSRARGDFKEFSDLDLMIENVPEGMNILGKLDEIFEESNLPIKIDLIDESNFAKSYRSSFERDKIKFF